MKKFQASLNGVTYTDRKEFFNALRKMSNAQIRSISVEESETTGSDGVLEEKVPEKPSNDKSAEIEKARRFNNIVNTFADTYCDILGINKNDKERFRKGVAALFGANPISSPFNTPFNTVGIGCPAPSTPSIQKKDEIEARVTFSELIDRYISVEPSHVTFTEVEEDNDKRLDAISRVLKKNEDNFLKDFNSCPDMVAAQFRKKLSEATEKINELYDAYDYDDRLHQLDKQIADLEKYIDVAETYGFEVSEDVRRLYKDTTYSFDYLSKKNDSSYVVSCRKFYLLLLDYYENIKTKIVGK